MTNPPTLRSFGWLVFSLTLTLWIAALSLQQAYLAELAALRAVAAAVLSAAASCYAMDEPVRAALAWRREFENQQKTAQSAIQKIELQNDKGTGAE